MLNRYRSMHRKVNNFFAPFFKSKLMSGRMEQPVLRIRKQRVLKIKDNPIGGDTLGVILDRRARRVQVGTTRHCLVGRALGSGFCLPVG